jgi:hypothetical protein
MGGQAGPWPRHRQVGSRHEARAPSGVTLACRNRRSPRAAPSAISDGGVLVGRRALGPAIRCASLLVGVAGGAHRREGLTIASLAIARRLRARCRTVSHGRTVHRLDLRPITIEPPPIPRVPPHKRTPVARFARGVSATSGAFKIMLRTVCSTVSVFRILRPHRVTMSTPCKKYDRSNKHLN